MSLSRVMPDEEFIEMYRDWRSQSGLADGEIEWEINYISELAKALNPQLLSKATKAVLRDFYFEQLQSALREGRKAEASKIMRASILVDGFYTQLKAERRKQNQRRRGK